jgi:NitT/TauT family transport system substrate-binding protein
VGRAAPKGSTMPTSRRTALAILGGGIAAASVAGVSWRVLVPKRSIPLRFILNWKYQGPQGWFFLAQDRGYFAREGTELTFDQGDGSAAAVPKVASGAYDLGFGDINALIELAARTPSAAPVGVYMLYNNPPFAVAVLSDGGIRSPRDLEGKTLGAPANDGALKLFPVFCKRTNIDPSSVKLTIIEPTLREQMLATRKVDGVLGYQTTIRFGLKQIGVDPDKSVKWMRYGDYGLDLYSNAIIASRRLVRSNPGAVRGVLRAINAGVRDALKDPISAVEAVQRREPLINRELELQRFRATLTEMNNPEIERIGLGDVSDVRLSRSIKLVSDALGLAHPPQLRQVFMRDFLPPLADRPHSVTR